MKPEDRFMYQQQESKYLKEQLQREEEERIRREMREKPKVSRASKMLAEHKKDPKYENQWDYLYGDSINKNKNLKEDRRTDEREFLKDPEAYTFHPNPEKLDHKSRPPMPEELSTNLRSMNRASPNKSPGAAGAEVFQINVNIKG